MIRFDAGDGVYSTNEFGGRGMGRVRVHCDRYLFVDCGHSRVPFGMRVPANRPPQPSLDIVGVVRRVAVHVGRDHRGGFTSTVDRHGTNDDKRAGTSGDRVRGHDAGVLHALGVYVVGGRLGVHGITETHETAVVKRRRFISVRFRDRGYRGHWRILRFIPLCHGCLYIILNR